MIEKKPTLPSSPRSSGTSFTITPKPSKSFIVVPSQRRHWLIGSGLAIIGLLGMAVAFWVFARPQILSLLSATQPSPAVISDPLATPTITPTPTPIPEESLTVLLMGRGGAGHDGGALTDTILLAKILLEQKRVIMLSIPRDLYVSIPYDGNEHYNKINSAYAIGIDQRNYPNKLAEYKDKNGGGALSTAVVTSVTDIAIDKYVVIDFSGFEQAIDLIDGVEITVERAFTDYEYPIAGREKADCSQPLEKTEHTPISLQELIDAGQLDSEVLPKLPKEFPCRYERLHFDAGKQIMNGKTALKYVRSRHSAEEGSDFARSRRQKILIEAVIDRLFSFGHITKLPAFLNTLRSHVDTDLSVGDLASWTPKANEIRSYPVTSLALTTDNYLWQGYSEDRQFILRPSAGVGKYQPLQEWLRSHILPDHKLTYPTIQLRGSAQQLEYMNELKEKLEQQYWPVKVSLSSTKVPSKSLTIYNSKVSEGTVKQISELAEVDSDQIATKSANAIVSDLLIQLP